jgi:tRNA(adenine34) deaminase
VLEQECSAKLSGFFKQRRQEKKISKNLAER